MAPGHTEIPRLVVVGIDGVPLTLLHELMSRGIMPAMKALVSDRTVELLSVYPTVSSGVDQFHDWPSSTAARHHGVRQ